MALVCTQRLSGRSRPGSHARPSGGMGAATADMFCVRTGAYFYRRPSTFRAMTSRWISLVPSPIVINR